MRFLAYSPVQRLLPCFTLADLAICMSHQRHVHPSHHPNDSRKLWMDDRHRLLMPSTFDSVRIAPRRTYTCCTGVAMASSNVNRFATIKLAVAEAAKGSEYRLVRDSVKIQVFESDSTERVQRKLCAIVAQHHGQDQLCARSFMLEADPEDSPGMFTISEDHILLMFEDICELASAFVRKEVRC
jgi:hypothetical protein